MSNSVNNNTTSPFLSYTVRIKTKEDLENLKKLQEENPNAVPSIFIEQAEAAFNEANSSANGTSTATAQDQKGITASINYYEDGYNATIECMSDDSGLREIGAIDDDGLTSYYNNIPEPPQLEERMTYEEALEYIGSGMTTSDSTNGTSSANGTNGTTSDSTNGTSSANNENDKVNDEEYQEKYGIREDFDADAVAYALHYAMNDNGCWGLGTDEATVHKYLLGDGEDALTDAELRKVMEAYNNTYGKTLEEDIREDYSYGGQRTLLGRLNEAQEGISENYALMSESEKKEYVKQLTGELNKAMEGAGTDEDTIFKIMHTDPELRKAIIDHYNSSAYANKYDFFERVDRELSGSHQDQFDKLYNKAMGTNKEGR